MIWGLVRCGAHVVRPHETRVLGANVRVPSGHGHVRCGGVPPRVPRGPALGGSLCVASPVPAPERRLGLGGPACPLCATVAWAGGSRAGTALGDAIERPTTIGGGGGYPLPLPLPRARGTTAGIGGRGRFGGWGVRAAPALQCPRDEACRAEFCSTTQPLLKRGGGLATPPPPALGPPEFIAGENEILQTEVLIGAVFGTQTFWSQTPPPAALLSSPDTP